MKNYFLGYFNPKWSLVKISISLAIFYLYTNLLQKSIIPHLIEFDPITNLLTIIGFLSLYSYVNFIIFSKINKQIIVFKDIWFGALCMVAYVLSMGAIAFVVI
jgi:hypothetical protein